MQINNKNIFCDYLTVSMTHETQQMPVHGTTGTFETLPDGKKIITYKALDVKGLHFSNVKISSKENRNYFSGNISRWNRSEAFQGLTLDECKIAINLLMRMHGLSSFTGGQFNQSQGKHNQGLIYLGATISRLDMQVTLATGKPTNRDAVLDHIQTLTFSKLAKICYGKNTYFGKESDSRLCRIYDKALELLEHALKKTDEPEYIQKLIDHLNKIGAIRIEWEYHRFLRKCDYRYWDNATHKNLCKEFLQDIQTMTRPIKAMDLDEIPTLVLGTLTMYMAGIDVKKRLNKNTFYKHKKVLLEYGYDISNQNIKAMKPKMKTIILTIAEVPEFYQHPEKSWQQADLTLVSNKVK